jgi:hypothetical protein
VETSKLARFYRPAWRRGVLTRVIEVDSSERERGEDGRDEGFRLPAYITNTEKSLFLPFIFCVLVMFSLSNCPNSFQFSPVLCALSMMMWAQLHAGILGITSSEGPFRRKDAISDADLEKSSRRKTRSFTGMYAFLVDGGGWYYLK